MYKTSSTYTDGLPPKSYINMIAIRTRTELPGKEKKESAGKYFTAKAMLMIIVFQEI